jgi:2-keto-4-pentenoate hydratase/2-oxohepta-3-ene-1,7-dioic acid hydratase in catechol pathway
LTGEDEELLKLRQDLDKSLRQQQVESQYIFEISDLIAHIFDDISIQNI